VTSQGAALWEGLAAATRLPWRKLFALSIAAALPLGPLSVRTPAGSYSPLELLLLLYAGLTLLWAYFDHPPRLAPVSRWGLFAGPALLLVLAGAVSLLVAEYPHLALREWRVVVLGPAVYYLLARVSLRGPRDARALALAFLLGAAGASLLALGQVVLGRGLVAAEGVARAVALYRSPNNLALLLDRALPLALALAWARAVRSPKSEVRSGIFRELRGRSFWLSAAALCALALFFTFSRGAWLAAAVACAFVLAPHARRLPAARRRRLLLWAVALGTPLLLAAGAAALRVERFRSLFAAEGTAVLRLRLWQSALEMALDHPWWGIGLDQFLYLYPGYMRPDAWREPNLSHPHNLALDFWLRLGLLGLAALAWTAWNVVRRLSRGSGTRSPLAWGAAGALVALVVHGLLDNSYFVIDLAYGCWVLLLLLELATEPDASGVPRPLDASDPITR
jgi:O-antigen ligase